MGRPPGYHCRHACSWKGPRGEPPVALFVFPADRPLSHNPPSSPPRQMSSTIYNVSLHVLPASAVPNTPLAASSSSMLVTATTVPGARALRIRLSNGANTLCRLSCFLLIQHRSLQPQGPPPPIAPQAPGHSPARLNESLEIVRHEFDLLTADLNQLRIQRDDFENKSEYKERCCLDSTCPSSSSFSVD